MSKCEKCGKDAPFACRKCETTFYCSKQCERSDWKRHKTICLEASRFPPCNNLGEAVEPSSNMKDFYLRISGDITNQGDALESWKITDDHTWLPTRMERSQANNSNKVHFTKDIAISKQQFIQFSESPSHHSAFLDQITGHPDNGGTLTPLMKEIQCKDNKQIRRLFNRHLECEICGNRSGLRMRLNHSCFWNNGNEQDFQNGIIQSVFFQHMLTCSSQACFKAAYERKNEINIKVVQLLQQHQAQLVNEG